VRRPLGVGRDDDALLVQSNSENYLVVCGCGTAIAYVNDIMAESTQFSCYARLRSAPTSAPPPCTATRLLARHVSGEEAFITFGSFASFRLEA
jgi:hypothetical protein